MLNIAALMGRLTKDPELRYTQNNVPVTSFTLAVDRRYSGSGGEKQTDFIGIVAWRQTAEFVSKWFKKGQLVAVDGSIQTRKYQDRDGNNRTAFEVVANNVHFAESKRDGEGREADRGVQTVQSGGNNVSSYAPEWAQAQVYQQGELDVLAPDDDDLPF